MRSIGWTWIERFRAKRSRLRNGDNHFRCCIPRAGLKSLLSAGWQNPILRSLGFPQLDTTQPALVALHAGTAYHRLGIIAETLRSHANAANLCPRDLAPLRMLDEIAANDCAWHIAECFYREAIVHTEELGEAWYNLGRVEQRKGALLAARANFSKAAALPPHPRASLHAYLHANAHFFAADISHRVGDDQQAMAEYLSALGIMGDYGVHHLQIANFLRGQGCVAESIPHFVRQMTYSHRYFPEFMSPPLQQPLDEPVAASAIEVNYTTSDGARIVFHSGQYWRVPSDVDPIQPSLFEDISDAPPGAPSPVLRKASSIAELEPASGGGDLCFHVITSVWGARHTEMFLNLTLPNILSPMNLPTLAAQYPVTYRIFTTPEDRARIEDSAHAKRLAEILTLEFVTPLEDGQPRAVHHIHWFHRAVAEAKRDGAMALLVPPDTLWSEGTFARCGEVAQSGCKGIAVPFLQVVSETCIEEVHERFGKGRDQAITIPETMLGELARRHLHPLTALSSPHSPHGRPALEMHWPVPGEGMLSRFAVRELFAVDPRRCPVTFFWYADGPEDLDGIYFPESSDDMAMLSVDPINKYIDTYILEHRVSAIDIARMSLHPLNNTQQTRAFLRHKVRWEATNPGEQRWREIGLASDRFARELAGTRFALKLWSVLCELGCSSAADVLAVSLAVTPLARYWDEEARLLICVPTNAAFDGLPPTTRDRLLAPGAERELIRLLLAHVAIIGDAKVDNLSASLLAGTAPIPATCLDGHEIHLVDSIAIIPEVVAQEAG